jgi:hypothetical protein
LPPPENGLVVSVDEKTGIHVTERITATSPAAQGSQPGLDEFDYGRQGMASPLSAM